MPERLSESSDVEKPRKNMKGGSENEEEEEEQDDKLAEVEDEEAEEEMPSFSDDEDFVSTLTDDKLCPDLFLEKPQKHESLNNIIIIDNLPRVDTAKLEKLKVVVAKVYNKFGPIKNEYYPIDEEGKTKGYGFFEFESEQAALEAVKQTDGYPLDKSHQFIVNLMSDFDRLTAIPTEKDDFGNLLWWLSELDAVDQFAILSDEPKKTTIYSNSLPQPVILEDRSKWTETHFVWSPRGTYLASFHEQGIAFWAGKDFRQVQRFAHRGVNYIDFSPCERYLVTVSPAQRTDESVIIWDIITGQKLRWFPFDQQNPQWPYFNFQDQYFAKQGNDCLQLYETETFHLVDKKPIKVPSIADFQWSPTDNLISYWCSEAEHVPVRVVLAEVGQTFQEVRSKTLFNVTDCKFCWQKRGDYLVVKVDRYTKKSGDKNNVKYTGMIYNFEIFHIREKNYPLDTLEVKETIQSFSVEPNGHKLCVISGESVRTSITFYKILPKGGKVETLKVMTQPVTTAFWSPNGQFLVLASVKTGSSSSGLLLFVDTNDMSIMSKQEHIDLSDVEWDPSGRYVATSVSCWTAKRDNAFKLWSFQGNLIFEKNIDRLAAFHWRPRPPSLLSEENIKEIRKNMKNYSKVFEQRDRMLRTGESARQQEHRRKQSEEFKRLRDKNSQRLQIQKQDRIRLRGKDTDSVFGQDQISEEIVEFLIKTEEVEMK